MDRILKQSRKGSQEGGNVLEKVSRKMRRKRKRDHETYQGRKVDTLFHPGKDKDDDPQ